MTASPSTAAGAAKAAVDAADGPEPIAVIGIGLRTPGGSRSADEFAEFLREGRRGTGPVPPDRWDAAFAAREPGEPGRIHTTGGGFLDRIDRFDARFFNISPKEAPYVDPQQRMLLETAWEALEHANIDPAPSRGGRGGVYIGGSSVDYALEALDLRLPELDGHLAAGTTIFPLSGRLSYFLGWRGPSLSVDTACASGLTAIHLAACGLRRGECDIALAGGVNALHHPRIFVTFSHANMLAADGRCKTFDESADGYARAEGCGVIVLKRMSDALRDGDDILALIQGTAVGQDGDSAGLTVPNGAAQEATMRAALADARLDPGSVQYVEAHGTGTPLGDPIEMGAINDVFAASHSRREPLVVGSVKTNLGHMEPAAGVIAVIKTVLQLRDRTIFPHINFETPSGRIPWDAYPVEVPTQPREWTAPTRRALVNSFGFAGSIAVAVLEEAPAAPRRPVAEADGAQPEGGHVFTLSAKDGKALIRQAQRYRAALELRPDTDVADLCYTANVGRSHFPVRLAGAVGDAEDLRALLDRRLAARDKAGRRTERPARKVAFLFAGQGSQYPGMGAALYRRYRVFREAVDRCDELFAPLLGESVREAFLDPAADPVRLAETRRTQPALFALEYALARLWMSWGVRPNAMIGHSIGEVVAAAVAGVFDLPDAALLVATRARLMQAVTAPGGMVAVTAPADEVAPLLEGFADLALAAVNAPNQCVVSGGRDSLERVRGVLEARGVQTKPLAVSHAFHSPLMDEVADEFRAAIAAIRFHEPSITLISNVTGQVAHAAQLRTPDYWVGHIAAPVQFAAGMAALGRRGWHAMVEIGPSSALTSLARQCVPPGEHRWATSLNRKDRDGGATLRALTELYSAGLPIAWGGVHADRPRRRVTLPSYAFEQKRYWLPNRGRRHGLGDTAGHPLLGREVTGSGQAEPGRREAVPREFAASVDPAWPTYLADHVLLGRRVFPAAGFVEAVLAAQDAVFGETTRPILDLRIEQPLALDEDRPVELRTRVRPEPDGRARVEIVSVAADPDGAEATPDVAAAPQRHATALIGRPDEGPRTQLPAPTGPAEERSGDDVYSALADLGLDYGPGFRLLTRAERRGVGGSGAPARVDADLDARPAGAVEILPPEVFEAALHAVTAWAEGSIALLPTGFGRIQLLRKPRSRQLRVVAGPFRRAGDDLAADLSVFEGDDLVLSVADARFADAASVVSGVRRDWYHEQRWVRRAAGRPVPRERHVLALGRARARLGELAERGATLGISFSAARDLDEAGEILRGPRPVTDLWWQWTSGGEGPGAAAFRADAERNYRELLGLVALLDKEGFGRDQRLWLLTERGQFVPGDPPERPGDLAAATLWGFGHVLLNEYPAFRATLVDLPGPLAKSPQADGMLLDELLAGPSDEYQVAFRGGRRLVRRLVPSTPTLPDEPGVALRAVAGSGGADRPARVEAVPVRDRAPGPGEIQVLVHAASVTPADAAAANSATDAGTADDGPLLGSTAAGTVVAAGPGATFQVGDQVTVIAPECLSRRVTVPSDAATLKPAALDFAAAVAPAGAEVCTLDEIDEAFRATAAGSTAVLDFTAHRPRPYREVAVRPDRTYLVTGGLGGLGLAAARKLVAQGARHLALVGRREPEPAVAAELAAGLGGAAEITVLRADISDPAGMARIAAGLADKPPVGGILHTAGVLADGPVSAQSWETIDRVFQAKVYGTWLLHEAAQSFPELEFFVGYSSAAAGLGGVTQSNYAAANAFMDNLMRWRTRCGRPGLSINWGPWTEVGMSSRLTAQIKRAWEDQGIRFFSPARGTAALIALLGAPTAQVGVGECDWVRFVANKPIGNALYERVLGAAASGDAGFDVDAVLGLGREERTAALDALVRTEVCRVLRLDDPEDVEPDAEFLNLGLDSLTAMELRSGLQGALRTPLPASLAFDHPTAGALAEFLDRQLVPQAAADASASPAEPASAARTEQE